MKKTCLLLALVATIAPSCRKNYTCNCVVSTTGSTGSATKQETITARSQADALSKCDADMQSYTYGGGTFNCTVQ